METEATCNNTRPRSHDQETANPVLFKLKNMSTTPPRHPSLLRHAHKTSVTTSTILLRGDCVRPFYSPVISKTHRSASPPAIPGCRGLCRQCRREQGPKTQSLPYLSAGSRSKVARHCGWGCEPALCQGLSGTETRTRGRSLRMAQEAKAGELAQGGSYILWGNQLGQGHQDWCLARAAGRVRKG